MERVRIDPLAFLTAAAAMLVLPLDWLVFAAAAAVFHELCHYLAIRLTRGQVLGLQLRSSGAVMETEIRSRGAELFCAAAGPAGSIFLILTARWLPKLAICGVVHGLFNLLPLYPLDGGRILSCLASPRIAGTIRTVIALMALAGAFLLLKYSLFPLILIGFAVGRCLSRKIPCKEARLRVQ